MGVDASDAPAASQSPSEDVLPSGCQDPTQPIDLGVAAGASDGDTETIWVANWDRGVLQRVDLATGCISEAAVGPAFTAPHDVVLAGDSVWVGNYGEATVERRDADTLGLTAAVSARAAGGLAFDGTRVWLLCCGVTTMEMLSSTPLPNVSDVAATADGGAWVSFRGIGRIARYDRGGDLVTEVADLPRGDPQYYTPIAVTADHVAVAAPLNRVTIVSAISGEVIETHHVPGLISIGSAGDSFWVLSDTEADTAHLQRIG